MNNWSIPNNEYAEMIKAGIAWELIFPGFLPMSYNAQLTNPPLIRHRAKRQIDSFIASKYFDIPPAKEKRAVQIYIVKNKNILDDEPNLDCRSKHILDSLVTKKLLRDDNINWLEWHHVRQHVGTHKGTIVRLWIPK